MHACMLLTQCDHASISGITTEALKVPLGGPGNPQNQRVEDIYTASWQTQATLPPTTLQH